MIFRPDRAVVTATLIGQVKEGRVATWVIALSVIGGVLLFLMLVTGLIKVRTFLTKWCRRGGTKIYLPYHCVYMLMGHVSVESMA